VVNSGGEYAFYVGVDWGSQQHQVVVLDHARQVVEERQVAHTAEALAEFGDALTRWTAGRPETLAVAIEMPRGAVVELLLERGVHVFALNPRQLDRFRDRFSMAGAKDDRRDAWVLAQSLATDRVAFRRVAPEDATIIHLRELSRLETELEEELRRLTNRLRDQLHRIFPQVLGVCPAADEPWLWDLLTEAPTPPAARQLSQAAVARLLKAHRIRRLSAEQVHQVLQTPAPFVAPGTQAAVQEHIALLLPRVRLTHTQRQQCRRRLDQVLEQVAAPVEGQPGPRDATILRSLTGVGRIVAARLFAEAARPLAERDYHALRTLAGVAPVTRQSGKRREVRMRYGCDRRVREAVYHWARIASQREPRWRAYYARLTARGCSHGRALRSLGDRLLAILMAMLRTRTVYDPQRGQAAVNAA
jgi:transposase